MATVTDRWLSASEQLMWRSYLSSHQLLVRILDQQLLADAEISLADYELLALLSEAPLRRLRMSELADKVVTTRSGITRAVGRLVAEGWLRRVECEEDKRGWYAELTDAGLKKLQAAAPGHAAAVRSNLFDLLSPRDIGLFSHAYEQIYDHLIQDQR